MVDKKKEDKGFQNVGRMIRNKPGVKQWGKRILILEKHTCKQVNQDKKNNQHI